MMTSFKAEFLDEMSVIHRSVNGQPYRHYAHVLGRIPPISRYRTERLMALLEATSDMSLEDLRSLARLKRNNNSYWKCILAFLEENRFTTSQPMAEIEAKDAIDSF